MPILFVVKRSRKPLCDALKRLVERPGLVAVVLDRRRAAEAGSPPRGLVDRLRQPLDADAARTWDTLGLIVVKVRALPEAAPAPRRAGQAAAGPPRRPARRR
jgi:hypothetical protein